MRFFFATLHKAKKLPYGSIRKWADGTYIKLGDHKWHKQKSQDVAHKQLKDDNLFHKKDLRDEFVEVVHQYADHLNELNLHPKHATPDTDDEFWESVFDDKNWFDDPGSKKFAEKVRKVVMKFHRELYDTKIQEAKDDAAADKKYDKEKKEREKVAAVRTKEVNSRDRIKIKDPLLAAKAAAIVSARKSTTEYAANYLDKKPIYDKDHASRLMGFTVKLNGQVGVVHSYSYYPSRGRILHGFNADKAGKVASLTLITENGIKKVDNIGVIQIMPDPMREEGGKSKIATLARAGIGEMVFDSDISSTNKVYWEKSIGEAFKEFNDKLGVGFNDKVKIHVYGKGGPKRGATADYSSSDKVIRLSAVKSGSFAALAHELGHALDDKMNGWHGTEGSKIWEIVRAYQQTPQGKSEADQLQGEKNVAQLSSVFGRRRKTSRYSNWRTKPAEIFARCFETYVAKKCPGWKKSGYAKEVIDDASFAAVKPLFDKLLKDKTVKKAFIEIMSDMGLV